MQFTQKCHVPLQQKTIDILINSFQGTQRNYTSHQSSHGRTLQQHPLIRGGMCPPRRKALPPLSQCQMCLDAAAAMGEEKGDVTGGVPAHKTNTSTLIYTSVPLIVCRYLQRSTYPVPTNISWTLAMHIFGYPLKTRLRLTKQLTQKGCHL
jgi:hypothetical protein